MRIGHREKRPVSLCMLSFLGLVLALAGWPTTAGAQQAAAVVASATGRVEVLPHGQTAWQPAQVGMRVVEGDDVRAFAGGNAELRLPDASTVIVAENTRFVVTKLDYGPRNERRAAIFHLAAGKLRGIVAHAAVALVQARQSIFSITTPTAVAAVRGTTVYAVFDPTTNETTILVTDGVAFVWDFCTGRLVEVHAGEITRVQGREPSSSAPDVRPGSDVVASETATRAS